ncbi:calcium/sodium antiporter [Sinisalibacter aestuarii]|uniref:Sodium:calcium antiporter n=1 Tax=Sinisalibacter aestuarii TaxID=2949426 RepID=A0ABQ5LR65_9RHOB|nr:calcium/sodium antiporter [Sinisalibacter aestuarii]GKY86741.1 sodium:calcium antiporter [Sinisalibacter aestuarii]
MDFVYATLGLLILLFAGDSLVRGAVNLSLRLGVPALIVSLTIVAFGTSAPELLISVQAVLDHVPGLALGNVVGSNTANILLVLGVPALLTGLATAGCDTRRNYIAMMAATALFMLLAAAGQRFGFVQGIVLLAGLGLMLSSAFNEALTHRRQVAAERRAALAAEGEIADPAALEAEAEAEAEAEEEGEIEGADPDMPWLKVIMFLALGLIGLPIGANILVEAATSIARHYGMSETVIGLTLVAVGTSLPELATTVMAAIRKQADVALGNVIGSNMFNLLAIIGVASLVGPIPVDPMMLRLDLWVMFMSSLLIAPFVFRGWYMGRRWGIVFVGLYLIYVLSLLGE